MSDEALVKKAAMAAKAAVPELTQLGSLRAARAVLDAVAPDLIAEGERLAQAAVEKKAVAAAHAATSALSAAYEAGRQCGAKEVREAVRAAPMPQGLGSTLHQWFRYAEAVRAALDTERDAS